MKKILTFCFVICACVLLAGCDSNNSKKISWIENKYTEGLTAPSFGTLKSAIEETNKTIFVYEDVKYDDVVSYSKDCVKVFTNYPYEEDKYKETKKYTYASEKDDYILTLSLDNNNLTITIASTVAA